MVVVAGLILAGIGLLSIFAKDFMWDLTQFNNQMKGVASERTDTWDQTTTVAGVACVLIGIVTVVLSFR